MSYKSYIGKPIFGWDACILAWSAKAYEAEEEARRSVEQESTQKHLSVMEAKVEEMETLTKRLKEEKEAQETLTNKLEDEKEVQQTIETGLEQERIALETLATRPEDKETLVRTNQNKN